MTRKRRKKKTPSRRIEPVAQEPPVEHQEPAMVTRPNGVAEPAWHFWPKDRPLPTEHVKVRRQAQPCPSCRRVYLPDGSHAACCMSSPGGKAYFRCQACGHRWPLPVRVV